jgi:succinyl-CoA synthetase beta subunit
LPEAKPSRDWRARLYGGAILTEAEGLQLLADYGIPTLPYEVVNTLDGALAAVRRIGFPVVLKTAAPGLLHKTEHDGVKLGLTDEASLRSAYLELSARLGSAVLVTRMARPTVELALGATIDPQFGPLVMVAAGGILIELLQDAAHALSPFGAASARRLLDQLRIRPLLDGARGKPPADIDALARTIARFSVMVADLAEVLGEIDINPLGVGADGAIALDALIVARQGPARR